MPTTLSASRWSPRIEDEDGTRIFNDRADEVTDFDPEEIEDWRPRYEGFKGIVEQEAALLEEPEQPHDYQNLLDETRELAGAEGLTKDELDEWEQRLEDRRPDAVRRISQKTATMRSIQASSTSRSSAFRSSREVGMPAL